MLSVNYNPSVLKAQNNLTSATSSLTRSLERMSTGYKINSAKDDAAGMFVAANLTTQIRGLLQARNNANDGISYITTGSESLMGMGKILNRIRDLAVQGANGVYDTASRDAMQAEADELTKELYRIKNSTVFNGQNIFGESETSAVTHAAPFSAGVAKTASVDTVPDGYTGIYSADDLNKIRDDMSGSYILMADIDLSSYSNWDPIGTDANQFQGMFDGNGHTIKNLKIDKAAEDNLGLFGSTLYADIRNVNLENVSVKGKSSVGGLIGFASSTTIDTCSVAGNVSGDSGVGVLTGVNWEGSINDSSSKGTASGRIRTGGLSGYSYDTGIYTSFSSANVSGYQYSGGLLGDIDSNYMLSNCYATGNVSGEIGSGGLLGRNGSTSISKCYATGTVTGLYDIGGFIGELASGSIKNSFWNKETSGKDDGIGLDNVSNPNHTDIKGLTTTEMADPQTYIDAGWFASAWDLTSAPPKLKWEHKDIPDVPDVPAGGESSLRLQIGANGDDASAIYADTLFKIGDFSVDFTDEEACRDAIVTVDELLEKINTKISDFGAVLNRLDSILTAQTTSIENLTAARSTIQDADIAEESASYVKSQILQQTTSSLLTQASSSQSSVIRALIGR